MARQEKSVRSGDPPKPKPCFVAFLDILGFRRRVHDSQSDPGIRKTLIRLLKITGAMREATDKEVSDPSGERRIAVRSRFFSDSLAFFLPESPHSAPHLLFVIRYVQDEFWKLGFCLRGSVVLGEMHWATPDDHITLGAGLIDAYFRESKLAIFPRIVITKELRAYIEHHCIHAKPFSLDNGDPLVRYIRRDADGIHFLDLLNQRVCRPEGETLRANNSNKSFSIHYNTANPSNYSAIRDTVKRVIDESITTSDDRIRAKYEWLHTYWVNTGPRRQEQCDNPACSDEREAAKTES